MAQYKVMALVEVEYDAEYTGEMTSALEEAERKIIKALSKLEVLSSCELKKVEVQEEDSEKGGKGKWNLGK